MTESSKTLEGKRSPEWIRPNLQKERGEIERALREFLGKKPTPENVSAIVTIFESAPIVELSDEEWKLLENTDSFNRVRPGHFEDAEMIIKEYNLELDDENKRDFKKILMGFYGGKMEMPAIIRNQNGKLHLVSGNTRLMISRAMNIRPKVVIGKIDAGNS